MPTFALSIAGFILFFPANLLPMVGITVLGNSNTGILMSGVIALFNEDMEAVCPSGVFLASIFFPLVHITLSLLISGHLYFNRPNRYLIGWMRWMHHLDEWVMLEVYMLGIIVACVKLMAIAPLKFGWGLYAFIALIIITTAIRGYVVTPRRRIAMSYEEIAETMECPVGTVRSRIFRAREAIDKAIAPSAVTPSSPSNRPRCT